MYVLYIVVHLLVKIGLMQETSYEYIFAHILHIILFCSSSSPVYVGPPDLKITHLKCTPEIVIHIPVCIIKLVSEFLLTVSYLYMVLKILNNVTLLGNRVYQVAPQTGQGQS